MRDKLIAMQVANGWSDRQMAERLGCSRPLWSLIRNGKSDVSDELAVRATGAFPELSVDLLKRAAQSATNTGKEAA